MTDKEISSNHCDLHRAGWEELQFDDKNTGNVVKLLKLTSEDKNYGHNGRIGLIDLVNAFGVDLNCRVKQISTHRYFIFW